MTQAQLIKNKGTLQFYNIDKLYFPKACVVCGNPTDKSIKRSLLGYLPYLNENKKDNHFNLPLCENCEDRIKINKKSLYIKIIVSAFLGLMIGLIFIYFTQSILWCISLIIAFIFIPLIFYRSKLMKRIDLDKYIKIESITLKDKESETVLKLQFNNENFADYISEINIEKNLDLKQVNTFDFAKTFQKIE